MERERERERIHCSNGKKYEEYEGESISYSGVAIRNSSTATVAETDEQQAQREDHKPDQRNDKEWSCSENHRLHINKYNIRNN